MTELAYLLSVLGGADHLQSELTASDPTSSVNSDLLREGLASIDSAVRYLGAYKPLVTALETASNLAKRERAGRESTAFELRRNHSLGD